MSINKKSVIFRKNEPTRYITLFGIRLACNLPTLHFKLCLGLGSSSKCIFFLTSSENIQRYKYHIFDVVHKIVFYYFLHIYGFYSYFVNLEFLVIVLGIFSHNVGNYHILLQIIIYLVKFLINIRIIGNK